MPAKTTPSLSVIVETSRGSRNKYKFLPEQNRFKLDRILPPGCAFPFDFGFVPSTLAEDGDPLDVLILADEALAVGSLVDVRVVGVIEATQKDDRKRVRNDRLIAIACESIVYRSWQSLTDVGEETIRAIEQFFVSYHAVQGREFTPRSRGGANRARQVLAQARQRLQ